MYLSHYCSRGTSQSGTFNLNHTFSTGRRPSDLGRCHSVGITGPFTTSVCETSLRNLEVSERRRHSVYSTVLVLRIRVFPSGHLSSQIVFRVVRLYRISTSRSTSSRRAHWRGSLTRKGGYLLSKMVDVWSDTSVIMVVSSFVVYLFSITPFFSVLERVSHTPEVSRSRSKDFVRRQMCLERSFE